MKNNTWSYTLIKLLYKLLILALIFMIIMLLQCLFSPADAFSYETSHTIQHIHFRGDAPLTTLRVSKSIINISNDTSIKTVYLWTFIVKYLLVTGLLIYVLKGIASLAETYMIKKKRFEEKHELFLRNAAIVIFISSWTLNLLLHMILSFEGRSIGLQVNHMVYLPGIILALVFNVFAEVFKHGIILQDEYDHTL